MSSSGRENDSLRTAMAPPRAAPLFAGSLLFAGLAISMWLERFSVPGLVITIGLMIAFIRSVRLWHRTRSLTVALVIDVLLIFVYLWSLDERIHVTIDATRSGYMAMVGSDAVKLAMPARPGHVGLVSGSLVEYRVGATGEAFDFSRFNPRSASAGYLVPGTNPIALIGQDVRLATPKPAWTNLHTTDAVRGPAALHVAGGGFNENIRGEWEGAPGAIAIVPQILRPPYTVSADLFRPDGTQGVLVGIDGSGRGYELAVRLDQPDVIWFTWDGRENVAALSSTPLHVPLVASMQRVARLLLGNVIAGLILITLTPLLYLLFAIATTRLDSDRILFRTMPEFSKRGSEAGAVAIAIAGFAAAALISALLLQRIPHVQDSVAYLFQAKTLALGRLSVPSPRLPAFFSEDFLPSRDGRWFGKYPPGWPLLLTVGVLLHLPWLVNPILAAADLFLLFLIGREVHGAPMSLLATVLMLFSPFFLFLAGSFMAHTATLFYLSAFACLTIRWVRRLDSSLASRRHDPWTLLPSGFFLGMAFLTRQLDAIAFAVPFLLLLLGKPQSRRLSGAVWVALGAIVPLLALLLYNWKLTGSPFVSPYSLWWGFDHPGFGANVGNGGFTFAQGLWNTSYNLEILFTNLFGWPFYLTLAIVAVPFLLGRATRWDALFAASALCTVAAYVFYWAPGVMYGPRYYYGAIPSLALLTARGLQELYRWPLRLGLTIKPNRPAAALAPALLLLLLWTYNLAVYLPAQLTVYRGYNFVSAASIDAVSADRMHHALVFVVDDSSGSWWSYGSVFSSNDPLLSGDIVYARDRGRLDKQLMALYPGRSYYRLNYTTLTRLRG